MKASLYNTILFPDSQHALIYNALSDMFLAINKDNFSFNVDDLLSVTDRNLIDKLIGVGALVNKDIDETAVLTDMIREYDHSNDIFHLHINPTLDCNFRCHYCYESHLAGSRMKEDTIESVKRLIDRVISGIPSLKGFSLSFFGGEPLIGFGKVARPLTEYLIDRCREAGIDTGVHYTTNGYLITDEMMEFFAKSDTSFQITLDGHRDLHDTVRRKADGSGSYDKIVSNIRKLALRGCPVLVRINFTKDNIHSVPAIIEDFKAFEDEAKKYIRFDLQQVWQDRDDETKSDVDEEILRLVRLFHVDGLNVTCSFGHDRVRNSCYGDKRHYALVNYDGYVFRCTARDFTEKNRAGVLKEDGSIEWFNNQLECRLAAKFSKRVCHTCRIAPICGGGCCQQAIEHTDPDKCMYGYTDKDMDRLIANRFEYRFIQGKI